MPADVARSTILALTLAASTVRTQMRALVSVTSLIMGPWMIADWMCFLARA